MRKFGVLTILALGLGAYSFNAEAAPPTFAGEPALAVAVSVDTEICASIPVQCNADVADEHSFAAAADTNHNPIRIFVLVSKRNGDGVSGLLEGDFTFNNSLVPAGGGSVGLCDITDCGVNNFQEATAGDGLYSMFLDRIPAGNWKAGTYGSTMAVSFEDGGKTFDGIALVTFTIP